MIGLGTLINVAAIVVGGGIGLAGGKRLSSRAQQTLIRGMAVCVLFVAIGGVMEEMLVVENGALRTRGTLMLVVSIALGGLMGELLDLDRRLEGFGRWLREKSGNGRDSRFLDGFITATMTVSIGAMAIVGAVEDGIHGDYTILAAKSLMDFVIILVMASSLGKGCLFSAIPVGLLQGSVTLLMPCWACDLPQTNRTAKKRCRRRPQGSRRQRCFFMLQGISRAGRRSCPG